MGMILKATVFLAEAQLCRALVTQEDLIEKQVIGVRIDAEGPDDFFHSQLVGVPLALVQGQASGTGQIEYQPVDFQAAKPAGPDEMTFTAGLADGGPLPDWLGFNADTLRFTGLPPLNYGVEALIVERHVIAPGESREFYMQNTSSLFFEELPLEEV